MSDRILSMISKAKANTQERLDSGKITQADIERANENCNSDETLSLSDYALFQNLKSLAVTDGTLTLEEGQTIYGYLGETLEHFRAQDVQTKTVLLKLFTELLGKSIRQRRGF